jgi:hypothetical protein
MTLVSLPNQYAASQPAPNEGCQKLFSLVKRPHILSLELRQHKVELTDVVQSPETFTGNALAVATRISP